MHVSTVFRCIKRCQLTKPKEKSHNSELINHLYIVEYCILCTPKVSFTIFT